MLEDIIIPKIIINRFTSLMNIDYEDLLKTHISVRMSRDCDAVRITDIDKVNTVSESLDLYFDQDNPDMIKAYGDFVIFPFRIETTLHYFFDKLTKTLNETEEREALCEFTAFALLVRTIVENPVPAFTDHTRMAKNIILAASAYDIAEEIWLSIEERLKTSDPFFFSTYTLCQSLMESNMCEAYGKDVIDLCLSTFIGNTVRMDRIENKYKDSLSKAESDELLRLSNSIMSSVDKLTDVNADNDDVMTFTELIDEHDAYINALASKYT